MEMLEKVKMEPNLLEIQMDEHLMTIQHDTMVALNRFEKSGLEFDKEFLNYFLKQSFDCLKQACIKYSTEAKLRSTRDMTATMTPSSGTENTTIPFLGTEEAVISMEKGGKSLKRKAEDALNDDNELMKRRKTMENTVHCDQNGDKNHRYHPKHTVFFCVHCLDEGNPAKSFSGTIDKVYDHWLTEHLNESICKPFQFYPIALASCFHCKEVGIYHDLARHHKEQHGSQQFTIIDRADSKKCGICHFKDVDMVKHFKLEHKSITKLNCLNPIIYSETRINDLLTIDFHQHLYGDPKKPGHLICGFCQKKIDCDNFLRHFNEHSYSFKCSYCTYYSANLVELVLHEKSAHNMDSLNFHCFAFSKWIRKKFLNTTLVFGNGLILKNFNVARTNLDTSKQFDEFIKDFLYKKRDEVGKSIESGEISDISSQTPKPMQVYIEIE